MPRLKLLFMLALTCLLIACDPLAPNATPIVIVITQTPLPTRTRAPLPSATPTTASTASTDTASSATESAASDTGTMVLTPMAFTCTEVKGQVIDLTLSSKILKGPLAYRAYLPPCYTESTRRYPYVILMSGSDKDETEWTDTLKADQAIETGLAMQALPPMILIMPRGGDLMNLNIFDENSSWESVILKELMPEIEKNFCTWNAREGRAIGGISRGGFWAFEIGFRHPDLFGAVGGHSAFFDLNNAPPAFNPMSLAKTVQFAPGTQPRLWLDVAKGDDVRPNIEIVQKTLAGRNIDPGYTVNPDGDHTVEYWAAHVSEYLSFYGQTWPRTVTELPSCLQ